MGPLNVLDIGIIVVMLIFCIAGFSRGFLQSLLKLFSSIASLAIAIWLSKPVAAFINTISSITAFLGDKISEAVVSIDPFFTAVVGQNELLGGTAGESITGATLKGAIADNVSGLSGVVKTVLNLLIKDNAVIEGGTQVSSWIGTLLGGIATLIIATILVYIGIRIAIGILSKIFDAITKSTALGGLDRLLGLAFGAAKGALVIGVIFTIYMVLAILPGVSSLTGNLLDNSYLAKPIYNFVSEIASNFIHKIDFNAFVQSII